MYKHISLFENYNSFYYDIIDCLQYLIDDWDLVKLTTTNSHKYIRYLILYNNDYEECYIIDFSKSFKKEINLENIKSNKEILLYFDLTGPNDFYKTRNKFIKSLEELSNRINKMNYKSSIISDYYYSNHFLIRIKQ